MEDFLKKIVRDLDGKLSACLNGNIKEAPPLAAPASHLGEPITYDDAGRVLYKGRPYEKALDIYPDSHISLYAAAVEEFLRANPGFMNQEDSGNDGVDAVASSSGTASVQ